MFSMQKGIKICRARVLFAGLAAIVIHSSVAASVLSLEFAEQLALSSDPGVQAVQANQRALEEMSVAAEQLPDPLLKMGLMSLPTDTFNLGQEAMTQVQVGLVQKFPRGKTRELTSEQIGLKSRGLGDMAAAETGIELARQKYKPEFALDVTYGGRGGTNPNGSSRTDMLTAMVVMDIPLFTKNRQDRVVAAQIAESSAAMFSRDDLLRRMRSEVDFHLATYQRQQQRIDLFENSLLPEAEFSSEASFGAYQSSLEDLTTLLRTRITEFDLQLEHARLLAEVRKTEARLLYLEGE